MTRAQCLSSLVPRARVHHHARQGPTTVAVRKLVVFDPGRIADVATYENPRQFPAGIRAVYVNGAAVRRDDTHTGARPGRALRRGRE